MSAVAHKKRVDVQDPTFLFSLKWTEMDSESEQQHSS